MPLSGEMRHHLQELVRETFESVSDEEAEYLRKLVSEAHQTNNAGAVPRAYSDAALHALQTRFDKTLDRLLNTLEESDSVIDDAAESEMRRMINELTVGPGSLSFPPGLQSGNTNAVQMAFAQARNRLQAHLQRAGANRVRDLKMKMKAKQGIRKEQSTFNTTFNAPVGAAYINSAHHGDASIQIAPADSRDIDLLSMGHPSLEAAAKELRRASPDQISMTEKLKTWVSSAVAIEGLSEKIIQMAPHLGAWVRHVELMIK